MHETTHLFEKEKGKITLCHVCSLSCKKQGLDHMKNTPMLQAVGHLAAAIFAFLQVH